MNKLRSLYEQGYADAKEKINDIRRFLDEDR